MEFVVGLLDNLTDGCAHVMVLDFGFHMKFYVGLTNVTPVEAANIVFGFGIGCNSRLGYF